MKPEEILKIYIEDLLEKNRVGVSIKLMMEAERIHPKMFSYCEDEPPFDINYDARQAYYHGLMHAYKDILEKLKNEQ